MAFKLNNPPYKKNNTPIYRVNMEEGVMGKANNNVEPHQEDEVIAHEMVHIDQMKRGDLDYDNDFVYWKGKKYSRAQMQEGAKNLPWEAEAYKNA
jgi:hypothetical protein